LVRIFTIFLPLTGFFYFLLFNRHFLIPYLLLYYVVSTISLLVQRQRLGRELITLSSEESPTYRKLFLAGVTFFLLNILYLAYLTVILKASYLVISLILGIITALLIFISHRTFRRRVICEEGISGRECDNIRWGSLETIYWNESRDYLVIFLTKPHPQKVHRRFILKVDEPVRNEVENLLRKIFMENKIKDYQKNNELINNKCS